jgi:hypothetical protein
VINVLLCETSDAVDIRLQLERFGVFAKEKGTRYKIQNVPIATHPARLDINKPHRWI